MNLKIRFVPYEIFKKRGPKCFIKDLKDNKIILIDAKLDAKEEAGLIKDTMEKISYLFSGIEMGSLDVRKQKNVNGFEKLRNSLAEVIMGKKRGLTIIGPAKVIHRIEKNPEELRLFI